MSRVRTVRAAVPKAAAAMLSTATLSAMLSTAIVIGLALVATDDQAVTLGLPAGLLLTGGLITAANHDPAIGQRISYLSGFWAGVLLSRTRSAIRHGWNRHDGIIGSRLPGD
jgi:hypothetical protein